MKRLLTITITLLAFAAKGQVTHNHTLKIGVGNEWNAFLSPSSLLEDDELFTQSQLWDNGTYQFISLKNGFKVEGDKFRLKLKANGSLGVYQTAQNSNRYTYRMGVSYRLKYMSKKYLELAPEVFRKRREGVNADNAVLTTPFSYTLIKAPLGLDFYLGNKAWLKTQLGYLYKNYDKSGGEKLYYQAPYFEALISKKWETESITKKLTLTSTTQARQYHVLSRIEDEEDEESILREGSRDWTYQFTSLILDFSKNESNRKLGLGLYHTSRFDNNNRSTFHEVGPGIQYQAGNSKVGFKSNIKYLVRSYEKLSPGAGNDTPLQYGYLRGSLELEYTLTKKSQLYGKGNFVNRTSNNPDQELRSFREYFNGYVEMGIKMNW